MPLGLEMESTTIVNLLCLGVNPIDNLIFCSATNEFLIDCQSHLKWTKPFSSAPAKNEKKSIPFVPSHFIIKIFLHYLRRVYICVKIIKKSHFVQINSPLTQYLKVFPNASEARFWKGWQMTRAKVDLARKKILFLALHSLWYCDIRESHQRKREEGERKGQTKNPAGLRFARSSFSYRNRWTRPHSSWSPIPETWAREEELYFL